MIGRPRGTRYWGAMALVAVAILGAGIGQTSLGHTILRKAGIAGEPTNYTSLAFAHPQALRTQLGSRPANVDVSFAVQNTGDAPRDYQWSVSLVQGRYTRDVAAGSVRIASGHGATITRSAKSSCTQGKVRIVVSLAKPAESIDAWIACSPPRSSKPTAAQSNRPLSRHSSSAQDLEESDAT
jgi:hypothetical protein